jgi:hypothetical protein
LVKLPERERESAEIMPDERKGEERERALTHPCEGFRSIKRSHRRVTDRLQGAQILKPIEPDVWAHCSLLYRTAPGHAGAERERRLSVQAERPSRDSQHNSSSTEQPPCSWSKGTGYT